MNPFKKSTVAAAIIVAMFSSVGCVAGNQFIQTASDEVFFASESEASNLYQRGQRALDEGEWRSAIKSFSTLAEKGSQHTDAAIYWTAYAQYRANRKAAANKTLNKLFKEHQTSRWIKEAKALQAEISGVDNNSVLNDSEIKEIALNSLLHVSPEKALPILKKTLKSDSSEEVKEMALFVLSQLNSSESKMIILDLAKDSSNEDLQESAVQLLAISGDKESRDILAGLYEEISNPDIKQNILQGFMISGDKTRLLDLAKKEKNEELRASSVELLAHMGVAEELIELYKTETSVEVKQSIIASMMHSGNSEGISFVINNETNPELLGESIQMLGLMGGDDVGGKLEELWQANQSDEIRDAIFEAWMLRGDTQSIVKLLKTSDRLQDKVSAIEYLGVMKETKALKEMYKVEQNEDVKAQLLESLMVSGDASILQDVLHNEQNEERVMQAIELASAFGVSDIDNILQELYNKTQSNNIKNSIIESWFIRHDTKKLMDVANNETDTELQYTAIEMLAVSGKEEAMSTIKRLFNATNDIELKSKLLESFMVNNDVEFLIKVFREESNSDLRRDAVRYIAAMDNEEAQALILELLEKE